MLNSRVENVIKLKQIEKKTKYQNIGIKSNEWKSVCNFGIYNDFHLNLFPSIDTEARSILELDLLLDYVVALWLLACEKYFMYIFLYTNGSSEG